jgi:hypothetical protein
MVAKFVVVSSWTREELDAKIRAKFNEYESGVMAKTLRDGEYLDFAAFMRKFNDDIMRLLPDFKPRAKQIASTILTDIKMRLGVPLLN